MLLTFVVLHLLGMRGCSPEKINLAIVYLHLQCWFSPWFATPAGSPSVTSTLGGSVSTKVEVLLPKVEVALGEPAGVGEATVENFREIFYCSHGN